MHGGTHFLSNPFSFEFFVWVKGTHIFKKSLGHMFSNLFQSLLNQISITFSLLWINSELTEGWMHVFLMT